MATNEDGSHFQNGQRVAPDDAGSAPGRYLRVLPRRYLLPGGAGGGGGGAADRRAREHAALQRAIESGQAGGLRRRGGRPHLPAADAARRADGAGGRGQGVRWWAAGVHEGPGRVHWRPEGVLGQAAGEGAVRAAQPRRGRAHARHAAAQRVDAGAERDPALLRQHVPRLLFEDDGRGGDARGGGAARRADRQGAGQDPRHRRGEPDAAAPRRLPGAAARQAGRPRHRAAGAHCRGGVRRLVGAHLAPDAAAGAAALRGRRPRAGAAGGLRRAAARQGEPDGRPRGDPADVRQVRRRLLRLRQGRRGLQAVSPARPGDGQGAAAAIAVWHR